MRNRLITALGILLTVLAVGAFILIDHNLGSSSTTLGENVLVAKENIPEGTVINTVNDASRYFTVKRIAKADLVSGYIAVNVVQSDMEWLERIKNLFVPEEPVATEEDLKGLVGYRAIDTIYKNEQVIAAKLTKGDLQGKADERLFAISISYIPAVAADIKKGDYVDVWITYDSKHPMAGRSEILFSKLKVAKLKDSRNAEIKPGSNEIPSAVLFMLTDEHIQTLSEKLEEGKLFLTKYGG